MSLITPILDWAIANPAYAWPIVSAVVVTVLKPRTPEAYAQMSAIRPTWLFSRLAALLQLIGALGLDPVKALQVISKLFTGKSDPMKIIVTFSAMLAALTFTACQPANGPASDAGVWVEAAVGIADGACTVIEGVTNDGTVRTVCATVEEVGAIANFINKLRESDAGTKAYRGQACVQVGTVCATSYERAQGVLEVSRLRTRRLLLDGGVK